MTTHPSRSGATVSAALLAGGRSRRMGRTKAVIEVGGRRMIDRVLDAALDAGCDPVVVVGGDSDELAPLAVPLLADRYPGEGPLGGVITALEAAPTGIAGRSHGVLVLPCDTPLVTAEALAPLIERWREDPGVDVVLARSDGGREPMCAIWSTAALAPARRRFDAGERTLHRVLDELRCNEVTIDATALRNVNAPGDLDAVVQVGSSPVTIPEITVQELAALGSDVRLIDVREPDEWAAGRVPHAEHIPLATVPDHLDRFDGRPTYVMCRSGGRSQRAAEFAAAHGHDVVNVAGGILAWVQAGHDVESDATGDVGG